ncbi:flagellar protein FlaG [Billgrantia endophytica]|uniref:Flagellar protein n=1 Tax=Billgrantia endophytica TaxID=2033802 RepID=A0A2N7UBC8_9GAMM|nr:flagellar protein FlaG [Halomonas endophytica]PMR77705.1 flagellar protein [Halomonas endophytica]
MSSPLTDATSTLSASYLHDLTPRERKESVIASLPTAGGVLAQTESAQAINPAELVEPIQRINEVLRQYGVEFKLNDVPSRVITQIVDRESGEVLRQIPSEEVLAIAERLQELQGNLIDLKA